MLINRFEVSQRHACRVVGQHRATQRNVAAMPDDDEMALRDWLRAFSASRPRWGWETGGRDRPAPRLVGQQQADTAPLALQSPQSPFTTSARSHSVAMAW